MDLTASIEEQLCPFTFCESLISLRQFDFAGSAIFKGSQMKKCIFFLLVMKSVCCCPQGKIISSAAAYIIISSASSPVSPVWFRSYQICIHCHQNMNPTKWGSKKKSNEKLNRLAESLELVSLSACLLGVKGRYSHYFSPCAHIFAPQKAAAMTTSWPLSQTLIRSSVTAGYICCFAMRGEVSGKAEILWEERHLISTLRELLGCQPGGCNSVHCVTLSTAVCGWSKMGCGGCGLRYL